MHGVRSGLCRGYICLGLHPNGCTAASLYVGLWSATILSESPSGPLYVKVATANRFSRSLPCIAPTSFRALTASVMLHVSLFAVSLPGEKDSLGEMSFLRKDCCITSTKNRVWARAGLDKYCGMGELLNDHLPNNPRRYAFTHLRQKGGYKKVY